MNQIAKALGVDRSTVSRWLKSHDVDGHLAVLRAEFTLLGAKALRVVERALDKGDIDSAWKVLNGIGLLNNSAARPADVKLNVAINQLLAPSASPSKALCDTKSVPTVTVDDPSGQEAPGPFQAATDPHTKFSSSGDVIDSKEVGGEPVDNKLEVVDKQGDGG